MVPKPITLEPCFGNKAAVLSVFVRLPRGLGGIPPPGQSGLAVASALVDISQQMPITYKDKSGVAMGAEGGLKTLENTQRFLLRSALPRLTPFSTCSILDQPIPLTLDSSHVFPVAPPSLVLDLPRHVLQQTSPPPTKVGLSLEDASEDRSTEPKHSPPRAASKSEAESTVSNCSAVANLYGLEHFVGKIVAQSISIGNEKAAGKMSGG
ncbi:attractin-like [Crotalus adamanteus]|uniref:Attractin-like n=1 Tax=Crotalus adamanteus TaxID=8729 RepID=A0AAW1BA47_CROAD